MKLLKYKLPKNNNKPICEKIIGMDSSWSILM
jgi:hypothetical protein